VNVSSVLSNLGFLASQNLFLAYFIIYLATIFFGNISAFTSFWIVYQGHFGPWGVPLLVPTIFLSNMTGDLLWYSLGRGLRNTRFGHWVKRHLPWHENMEQTLIRNGRKWMFLSKFAYAASFPVIFSVGWTNMEFKKFFRNSLLSILTWIPVLFGLAYGVASGLSPLRAVTLFHDFELTFFVGLVLFIFLDYLIAKAIGCVFEKKKI
jgi:membrane protein DedA with SNARE-associated domain